MVFGIGRRKVKQKFVEAELQHVFEECRFAVTSSMVMWSILPVRGRPSMARFSGERFTSALPLCKISLKAASEIAKSFGPRSRRAAAVSGSTAVLSSSARKKSMAFSSETPSLVTFSKVL